jgi:hypothetical protein
MSRLVRLYPKAWRDRYEGEFLALLEERPPTIGDVLDTIRGAADAHLHPQRQLAPSPWTHRIPGMLALAGGLIYAAGIFLLMASWAEPNSQSGSLIGWSLLLMFLSLPGDYMAAHGRRIAVAFGTIGVCILGAHLTPWPTLGLFAVAGYLTVLGGMLTMGAVRAGIGASGRWILLALAVGLPLVLLTPIGIGIVQVDGDPPVMLTMLLPFGLAWVFLGLRMALRGAPTIVDPPLNPVDAEVAAA